MRKSYESSWLREGYRFLVWFRVEWMCAFSFYGEGRFRDLFVGVKFFIAFNGFLI